ncbi:hypothetical protein SAMN05661096_00547 [Marivirga sericea]|uniref:Uncharacterized protein n=1 Tax=Marivirga sericea TaxID=1028 RepID=A0A1X7IDX4_9BACT|nr:hypothetical protein [Marivirga sericea]SMG12846.1 hypothetical protein SAMN05661096_00547 [Marivirga sericea]
MNNSIYFILILLAGISCSEPAQRNDLSAIHQSLLEQRHFYYSVQYTISSSFDQSEESLYGLVSLNRNSDSGISSAYFGRSSETLPNYLSSMYLNRHWIHELSSSIFDVESADILTDSLHSPILINPDLLFGIQAESNAISLHEINAENVKWTFDLKHKDDQFSFIWNKALNKITELEYSYDVTSDNAYSRKWAFNYLLKSDYKQLATGYKHQNQIADQSFL